MATPLTQSEALHKLEEQLTCVICLEQYTNPKILPCFHSFCLDCLRGVGLELTQQQGIYSLPCPTCRSPCKLPQDGLDALPPSFTINNLTEVYNLLKKVTGKGQTSCDKCQKNEANRYCKQCAKFLCHQCLQPHDEWMNNHETLGLDEVANAAYQLPQAKPEAVNDCAGHKKPLEIFCETCEELICQLCTVKKHKDHNYDVVSDAYSRHKLILRQSSLHPLNQRMGQLIEAIAGLLLRRKEIEKEGERVKQVAIQAQVKEHCLDQFTERKINEEVDRVMEYKFAVTDRQTKEAEVILGQLTEWKNHMQQSLEVDTPQQVLLTKASMASHTESLLATVKEKKFLPIEQADFWYARNVKKSMKNISGYIGAIEYHISPPTVTLSFDHTPIVGQESNVDILLFLEDGSPPPVPLSFISCHLTPHASNPSKSPVQCTVTKTSAKSDQQDQYHVVFTPHTRGYHQLNIKLYNCTISGNSVRVPVSVPVSMRSSIVRTILRDFGILLRKLPRGVAVNDDGQVLISECLSHCITIFTRDGKTVRSFGSRGIGNGRGHLSYPIGIALTSNGTLLVADSGNHRIQEFTMDGECVSCVGSKGNGPLQFNEPCGIAINKTTGQVYIVDIEDHRVQVLNADLTFSHMFGSRGSGPGQFSFSVDLGLISGVAIDSHGFVYVADSGNHRIQKFTPEGKFESQFGSKGSNPGQLSQPRNVYFNNDLLYISEGSPNHRISVYTTTGHYVHSFGPLYLPYGVAMDTTTGYLYVCGKNGVHVF